MQELDYSDNNSYITNNKKVEAKIEEFSIEYDPNQKTALQLLKSFKEGKMRKDELYQLYICNNVALNLYQSLYKLKRGQNHMDSFKSPCQIKIYPKSKLMVIYLVVSYHYLRIKTELQYIRENENLGLKNNLNNSFYKNQEKLDIKESPISKLNNDDEINYNENEKEIIFTIDLLNFFKMLDLLLSENKDCSLALGLDSNFSVLTAQAICPDVFNQVVYSRRINFNLLKNDTFSYAISDPKKNNSKKNTNITNDKSKDNDNVNDPSNEDNSEINNKKSIKNVEKTKLKTNKNKYNQEYEESNNEYLEQKFMMDIKSAKYMIEGPYLGELFYFMRGLEFIYDNFSTHNIGISMTNDKALFYCPAMEKINNGRYIEELSKNINQQLRLNIKSLINHSFTPFANGFNSFYRTKFLSKFITSFYNKNDKRLLIKVNPNGKMVLSYAFSDPQNDMNDEDNKDKSLSEDVGIKDEIDNEDSDKTKRKKTIRDRLLDDENMGNIVEMIFYPVVFDLCKN